MGKKFQLPLSGPASAEISGAVCFIRCKAHQCWENHEVLFQILNLSLSYYAKNAPMKMLPYFRAIVGFIEELYRKRWEFICIKHTVMSHRIVK